MARYRRQKTEQEIKDELGENTPEEVVEPTNEVKKPETVVAAPVDTSNSGNVDWKQRHDDLRRYLNTKDGEIKELQVKLKELEEKDIMDSIPTTVDEINKWMEDYPKIRDVIKYLAREEASRMGESAKTAQKRVESLERDIKVREEAQKLMQLQPDFYSEIVKSEEFREWMQEAPAWAKKALSDGENPNAQEASDAIDLFKLRTGWKSSSEKKKEEEKQNERETTARESASSVKTPKASNAPSDNARGGNVWSESRVAKLSGREYERVESQIMEAIQKGEFIYDIRDSQ